MGMFAVKNDKGEWLSFDPSHESLWYTNNPTFFNDKSYAEAQNTGLDGSHIVELIEAPEKAVVSEDEAKILEGAKKDKHPCMYINWKALVDDEDRLMRAYVNGWTVEKPKRYVLPMPVTEYHNAKMRGNAQYYAVKTDTRWRPDAVALGTDDAVEHGYTVTQADIDAAPAWVKAIKPVEVTEDEQ